MKLSLLLLIILTYFLSCTTTQNFNETNILEINGKAEEIAFIVDSVYETRDVSIGPNPGPFIKFEITPQYSSYNKIELFIHSEILKQANTYDIKHEEIYIIIDENQTWLIGDLVVDKKANKISLTFDFDFTNIEGHINGLIEFNDNLLPFHILPANDNTDKEIEIQNTNNTALFNYITLQNGKVVLKDAKFTNSFDTILVAGLFAGDVDFDIHNGSEIKSTSNEKVFLANYTSDYELKWVKIIEGYPESGLNFKSIKIINENEIVIAGNIRNNTDIDPTNSINEYESYGGPESQYSDCFITSYNFNNQFWTYTYGGDTKDVFSDLIILEDGSIVATSYTSNSTGKVYFRNSNLEIISKPIMGSQNGVVLKLSNEGIYEWSRTINGNKWVWPREVKELNNSIGVFGDVLGALDINPSNEVELITPEVIPPNNGLTPFSFQVDLNGNVITKPKFLYPDTSGTDMRYKGFILSDNNNSLLISKQRDSAEQLNDTVIESNYSDWRWRQSADDVRGQGLDLFLNISKYDKIINQENESILINGDYKDGFFNNGKYWIIGIMGENYSINKESIPSGTIGSYKAENHFTENMIYLTELDANFNILSWLNIPLNQQYAEIENIHLIHDESHLVILGTVSNMRMQLSYKDHNFKQDYFFAKIPFNWY